MFSPHTPTEKEEMLRAIGVQSIEDLFQDVPKAHRFPSLKLPPPLMEMEALAEMQNFADGNETCRDLISFLGAGAYHHYIPAAVDAIIRRGEFYTAYTPYQPEISQGTLQAIFEYQSLIAALTGMEVCNASHYDGATAVAEAVNMAVAHFRGKRTGIVISPSLNPQYTETVQTYTRNSTLALTGFELDPFSSPDSLLPLINTNTALVIVQYPDFLGRLFDYRKLIEAAHQSGALVCVAINPIALGLLTPPGEFGADIVTGEGQPLGIPLSFGGPYLGLFATKLEFVRKMAGRLVGETVDIDGRRGYVLTLTAREQHIRREKATSNICTNQGLMALASAVYLSLLGRQGLRELAELCYHKAHYTMQRITELPGFTLKDPQPFFNEFVIHCPTSAETINAHLLEHGILGGLALSQAYPNRPGMENLLMIAVTEMNSRDDIEALASALAEVSHD